MDLRPGRDELGGVPPAVLDVTREPRRIRLAEVEPRAGSNGEEHGLSLQVPASVEVELGIDRPQVIGMLDLDPGLLAELPDRGLLMRLVRLDASTRQLPPVLVRKDGVQE